MKRLTFFIISLWLCLFAFSESINKPEVWQHLTIKDGLSNNFVTDIVQDKRGFLWVGTESGLNRFDGAYFRIFSMKNSTITGNAIQCLFYDNEQDALWVGTKSGLNLLNCATQEFESIKMPRNANTSNIVALKKAHDGGIWIVNHYDNIIHYNPSSHSCMVLSPKNIKGLPGSYRCIAEDAKSTLYIGHANEGLSIYNLKTKRIRCYKHNPLNPHSLPSNEVFCLLIDHYGHLWVGTDRGIALFDPVSEQFIRFSHQPTNPYSLIGDNIYKILEINDSMLWIASDMGGESILDLRNLTFKDPKELRFCNLESENNNDKSISSANIRALFQDSFGNIWIGNYSAGLDFVNHYRPVFQMYPYINSTIEKSNPAWSLYNDDQDILWVGGINQVSTIKDGKEMRKYDLSRFMPSALSHVTAIYKYQGKIILGIYDGGALSLDTHTGIITQILPASMSHVNSFCETPNGQLLLGAKEGLFLYDGKSYHKLESLSNQFFNLTPNGIAYDNQGKLWIGTYGLGVYVFDKNMKLLKRLDSAKGFASNAINQIFKDSKGSIWVAGQDGLAYIKDTRHPEKYINYGYKNGLNDIHIRSIHEDRNGDIWLALNSEIAKLNRQNKRIYNYNYNDGMPQSSFLDRAVIIRKNGDLCFGSFNGICKFNPNNLFGSEKVVPVQIVECRNIISQSKTQSSEVIIPCVDGKIELPYHHNSIQIAFAVPDFSQSKIVEYSYMIEGIDKGWISTQGEHYATFWNLPPGKYTFKVRARLKNQEWDNASIATMNIVIIPPLWLTWWAKLIYIMLIVLAIYMYIKHYKHQFILKNNLDLERRKSIDEKLLNDERLRFYTNVTHELRTPLTLILGPLEDLVSDHKLPDAYKNQIKIIHESALRLLNLINQILEFRKTETQNRKLTVAKGNISNLAMEIGLRYKELNRNDKVDFDIHIDKLSKDIYFDREIITTILNNLLSNAVKYTPNGKISLTLNEIKEKGSDYVQICVTDTGYGIEAEALPHIFDRYYQAKGKHQASGTGIGLALVKSLSELHEATLTVDSQQGVGTAFRLLLLSDNTYPTALHKEFEEEQKPATEELMQSSDIEEADTDKPLVLVVEDNEAIRDYIESSLSVQFRVLTAVDGKEGFTMAQENIPDMIISDIMMPVMDGIELCRKIKKDINTSHIPVILLTAKDSIQDKEEGYESGADSYLTKPFSAKLLISRIHNILESRKALATIIASQMEGHHPNIPFTTHQMATDENASIRLSKLDEDFLKKIKTVVEENMTQDLNVNFIQDALNMSHSTIYRKIKSLTGLSINEFIRKIRLRHGYEFLKDGYNVTEAAYSCGFGDLKHFRNSFKEEYGITPSQFIKNLKAKRRY